MVDVKLVEELAEYHKDQNIEELADLMEVIYLLQHPKLASFGDSIR